MTKINIVKMAFLPKAIYRFGATSVRIPVTAFTDTEEKKSLKFIWQHKRPRIVSAERMQ